MKRTHRKVRTGCLTCRRRRIRCDELRPECLACRKRRRLNPSIRCQYPENVDSLSDSDAGPSASTVQHDQAIPHAATSSRLLDPAILPDVPVNDKFLLDHAAKICVDLESLGSHLWTGGLSILLQAYHRSPNFDFVRHALCALSANHLSLLNKSISMVGWEYHHRGRAIRGLLSCLQNICNHQLVPQEEVANVDAILVTSFVLSWSAAESREYTQFMKGLLSTLDKAKHDSLSSGIISTFLPLPSTPVRLGPLPAPANQNTVLSEATSALTSLQKVTKQDKELDRAVSELRIYVQNARHSKPTELQDSQLAALFPIRSWLYWMPHAPFRLAVGDLGTMLVLAHYEMVKIAMQSLCPKIDAPLAVSRRADCLELLCQKLAEILSTTPDRGAAGPISHSATLAQIIREHANLIQAPEQYIRLYRAKNGR